MSVVQVRSAATSAAIQLVRSDLGRLRRLLEGQRRAGREDQVNLDRLEEELERAVVVEGHEVTPDVVTLDSEARLIDLDDGQELRLSPVLPPRADADLGRISVLAPLGMAVLGYRAGDCIEWEVPRGLRRMRVEDVTYQPEAAALRRTRQASYAKRVRKRAGKA